MPATLEVTTTRRTSSAAAASTTIRGASAFTSQTRAGRPRRHVPCRVEHDLAAAEGASQRGAVEHVRLHRLDLGLAQTVETRLVAIGHTDGRRPTLDASSARCEPMKPVAPVMQTLTTSPCDWTCSTPSYTETAP